MLPSMTALSFKGVRRTIFFAALAAGFLGPVGVSATQASTAIPKCRGKVSVSTYQTNAGTFLESILVGGKGKVYVSLQPEGEDRDRVLLVRYLRPNSEPEIIAESFEGGPGGLAWSGGKILWGSIRGGVGGDEDPRSTIYLVDPATGSISTFATGLGQANGVARAKDGTVYASNNVGRFLDRISPSGVTDHTWGTVESANGLVVSRDQKYLFTAQTVVDPGSIARIDRSDPSKVVEWWSADGLVPPPYLDGITRDDRGNLFVTSFVRSEVYKIDSKRRACLLASDIPAPTSLNFAYGRGGLRSGKLYISSYGGPITSISGAQEATVPG
jgi:hypothetical protein